MIKILFVCLGNICRSPLAEAICNAKIKEYGLESSLLTDSAGTSTYHIGEDPDPRSIEVARAHHTPISHKGRQVSSSDKHEFQYIMAMDRSNFQNIVSMLGEQPEGLYLMRDFDPESRGAEVPDPYYGGQQGFEDVYQMLDRSCEELIDFIREKHNI
ncbi:low molecular weight protein-tyrosine-phosphatase [Marinoscillum sp. MHG1-6]|uniref:low molecular weight protein-tyrosine-phosphatase n=1 Tax=Marinoscillum sp. MHG1-6 TaxID=2959627 RepID=UPI0021580846|nr:low molecular weight protein-tyrosine-phosphatase [Marinoscillum sp. MHG1-6]